MNVVFVLISFIGMVLFSGVCQAAGNMELKNETDRINYSVGYQIGGDFKSQGVELNPEAFLQGIKDALKKNEPLLSQEQMNTTLVNLKKKIITGQQAAEKQAGANFLAENAKKKGVIVLPSGVQYKILREGTGIKPTLKDDVKINYRITRVDGKEIGNTYDGGKPRIYPVAKAVPGLQEVLQLMAEGAKWQIALPGGTVSGGRDALNDTGVMIYEMELISVIPAKLSK